MIADKTICEVLNACSLAPGVTYSSDRVALNIINVTAN